MDDVALAVTWNAAWAVLGRTSPAGLQAELLAAWSEPGRHYHDLRHLRECMALWVRWRNLFKHPGEVALALWFHDAVYDPQATPPGSNELASAAWAARALASVGASTEVIHRVHDLVMSTCHEATAEATARADVQLLMDIDLAILGSPARRFAEYDQDVRREYAWVPAERYRAARTKVLQNFLDRPRLYNSPQAVDLLEGQARMNLSAAVVRLAQ